LGKSQFQQGEFEEAAATFSYMTRLYATQPAILGIARAWQAKSYVELDWIYDAEDIIVKQRRDTMHFRARKDWDFTLADYYLRSEQYDQAIPYLRQVIKHEKRRSRRHANGS
jgi:tetratricopeptide (TPR) repeat protein